MALVASPLFTRNTPMRNDGTAMWSLAMGIRILHRRRCTGGLWRATRPRTITPYWAKSPRNFETLIRPACGRASPFRGCINTNKSTGKYRFAATPRLAGKPESLPDDGLSNGRRPEVGFEDICRKQVADFPEARFWIVSGLPTIRPQSCLSLLINCLDRDVCVDEEGDLSAK